MAYKETNLIFWWFKAGTWVSNFPLTLESHKSDLSVVRAKDALYRQSFYVTKSQSWSFKKSAKPNKVELYEENLYFKHISFYGSSLPNFFLFQESVY